MSAARSNRQRKLKPIPLGQECTAQDYLILSTLENDARISFADLAAKLGLSKSPTWARVRDLKLRGVISGFRAVIDPAAMGLQIHAFVQIAIKSEMSKEFESTVIRHPAVLECHTIAGQADYLLHVLVASVVELDFLLRTEISRMPGVERLSTTVGLKTIKSHGLITECAGRQ